MNDNLEGAGPVRFAVRNEVGLWRLVPGDVLVFDPALPRGERIRLERTLAMHAGHLARCLQSGTVVPVGRSLHDARSAVIAALRGDQEAA